MNTFDDFLKKKLEEKKFSPGEKQIASFTQMLDEKEDRKRFLWWPWLVGVVILALGAFFIQEQNQASEKAVLQIADGGSSTDIALEKVPVLTHDKVQENELLQSPSNSANASLLPSDKISTPIVNDNQAAKNDVIEKSDSETAGIENQGPFFVPTPLESNDSTRDNDPSEELSRAEYGKDGIPQIQENNIPSPPKFPTLPETTEAPIQSQKDANEVDRLPAIVFARIQTLDLSSNIDFEGIFTFTISAAPPIKTLSHTKIGIDMGWGLASVKNGGTRENGQRIRIGAFAERNLNSRLSAQIGIGFQYEGDAFDFSKESIVSSQGFGLRSTVNTLDIKNLYEVYINAGVNWRKGRHTLSSLVQLGYVYGAKGDLVRYSESTFEGVTEERVNDVWLAVEGLNRFPVDIRLEYGFNVSQNLQLRFGLTVPVVSAMKNYSQEFNSTHVIDSRRNSLYPQLGIRYHLFKM